MAKRITEGAPASTQPAGANTPVLPSLMALSLFSSLLARLGFQKCIGSCVSRFRAVHSTSPLIQVHLTKTSEFSGIPLWCAEEQKPGPKASGPADRPGSARSGGVCKSELLRRSVSSFPVRDCEACYAFAVDHCENQTRKCLRKCFTHCKALQMHEA